MRAEVRWANRAIGLSLGLAAPAAATEPIIDMHVHGMMTERTKPVEACPGNQPIVYLPVDPGRDGEDPPTIWCPQPIASVTGIDALRRETIAALRRAHVVRAVLLQADAQLERWQKDAPGLFIPASSPRNPSAAALEQFRAMVVSKRIEAIGEVGSQYIGLSADDPKLENFWSLAEQADLPVGIHLGEGMPLVGASVRTDRYRASLTTPFQLETVLKKHPRLRLYVMHAASPLTDEMIAMLFTYPSLYVDVAANDWNMPSAQFYAQLKRLVDAGFSKRIMFGSDQTIFPRAIGLAIATINQAPFLSDQQKRDILYNNAARFLRLSKQQIAADHR